MIRDHHTNDDARHPAARTASTGLSITNTNSNASRSTISTATNEGLSELDRLAKARAAGTHVPVAMPADLPVPAPLGVNTAMPQEQLDRQAKARAAALNGVELPSSHFQAGSGYMPAPPKSTMHREPSLGTQMAQQMAQLAMNNSNTISGNADPRSPFIGTQMQSIAQGTAPPSNLFPVATAHAPGLVHRDASIGQQMAQQMAQGNAMAMNMMNNNINNNNTTASTTMDGVGVAAGVPEENPPEAPPPPPSFGSGLLRRARNISVRLRPGAYSDGGSGPGGFEYLRRNQTFEKAAYQANSGGDNRSPPRRPSRLTRTMEQQVRQQQQQQEDSKAFAQQSSKEFNHDVEGQAGGGTAAAIDGNGCGDKIGYTDDSTRKAKKWLWLAIALMLVLAIVAIVAGVVVARSSSSTATATASQDTTLEGTTAPIILPPVVEVFVNEPLPLETTAAITNDTQSAPYKAYQWLVQGPEWRQFTEPQRRQRLALAILYYATNGERWFVHAAQDVPAEKQWLNHDVHECAWFNSGNPCRGFNATTASLYDHVDYHSLLLPGKPDNVLPGNSTVYPGLRGTLPDEIGLLSALTKLDVGFQKLYGTIPDAAWTSLTELQDVKLYVNDLVGTVPVSFWTRHPKLKYVFLSENQELDPGPLPTEIGLLQELQILNLGHTQRTGSLPTELLMLTKLQALLLGQNGLTGTLPSEIGLLSELTQFEVPFNEFFGTLPTELGRLTMLEQTLLLGDNSFLGSIPTELGKVGKLQDLDVAGNSLSGPIPSELGLLSNLAVLAISSSDATNQAISGLLPLELFAQTLVNANGTTVLVPALPKLQELYLELTKISGSLPTEIGLLSEIELIRLDGNPHLYGTIPSQIGRLSALHLFDVSLCQLTGDLPSEIGLLSNLTELTLFGNQKLRGTIPDVLCPQLHDASVGCGTSSSASTGICGCDCPCQ